MGYPVGPLLKALALRIEHNLDLIDELAPKWGARVQLAPPYADTQLLISLLGVLVFPAERNAQALGQLLARYEGIGNVVEVVWSKSRGKTVEMTGPDGEALPIDPSKVQDLPRLLRNCIAHCNIVPINIEGRFGGIRVWNRDRCNRITFVADLRFDDLRKLAKFVLHEMAQDNCSVQLDDPPDPVEEARNQVPAEPKNKAPRLNDDVWRRCLEACDGDAEEARKMIDRVLIREADSRRSI